MSDPVNRLPELERKRGRPRSAARHHAILESTRELLAAGSYDQLTMEAIATRAGVSKQTVYKWWPSKASVVSEAVVAGYLTTVAVDPPRDTGDLAADLTEWVRVRTTMLGDPGAVALVRAMTAAAADGSTDPRRLWNEQTEPQRQEVLGRLRSAIAAGQVRPDADLDAATDAVIGVLLLQALSRDPRVGVDVPERLIDVLLHGLTPRRDAAEPT